LGIETPEHHEIAALSPLEPFVNAGDGTGTETGFLFDRGIGDSLPEHAGNLPSLGKFPDFSLGEQVAEKPPALPQALELVDGRIEIVDISRFDVFHALPE